MKKKQVKKGKQYFQSEEAHEHKKIKKPQKRLRNQKKDWLNEAYEWSSGDFQKQSE